MGTGEGAPGGDDYHQMWINPKDGNRMVLSSDQGTVVSVDGAKTWSTWYNQPTAEIYHIAASNGFPYWLVGRSRTRGVRVSTWSRMGILDFRNWEPTCLAGEAIRSCPIRKTPTSLRKGANAAIRSECAVSSGELPPPDPDDPNRRTWTLPSLLAGGRGSLLLEPVRLPHPRSRRDLGKDQPGPLARESGSSENARPNYRERYRSANEHRFGVVYTIGPSPMDAKTIWAGTDDGLIHVTR